MRPIRRIDGSPLRGRGRPRSALARSLPLLAAVLVIETGGHAGDAQAASAATARVIDPAGCSMAHCDQTMSDTQGLSGPSGAVATLWHDTSVLGSVTGLGCSTNTKVVACSLYNDLFRWTTVKVYSPTGAKVWSSSLLNGNAYVSAPMVDPSGGVIATDNKRLVRFGPTGAITWQTTTPGGTPLSPNITDDGSIVLATYQGPVSAYDSTSGALLDKLTLGDTLTIGGKATPGYFETQNTPAIVGNRIYVVTMFRDTRANVTRPYGRLYAIDFDRAAPTGKLRVAWSWDFTAPSGASPLAIVEGGVPTIYFDGNGLTPGATGNDPRFFAIRDLGATRELVWSHELEHDAQASAARDPRGGLWIFASTRPHLIRLHQGTGAELQRVNVDTLVNQAGAHVPSSALTVSGPASAPVLTFSAIPVLSQSAYVVALDLNTARANWMVRYDQGKGAVGAGYGQWPIAVRPDGRPVTVFTTGGNGVWGVGVP